ncbi:hypothetical protein C8F04DRAFT_1274927 [Mycena alexandri]|uniref:Uncharacterized protein n=1 Tax=Mycena alexandri TaxID=1745969 RepID=A0AAD6S3H6_9AGAR|nr:hypothetical protein C8F04DRAFT_1274927 [Mycena alexandri]
MANQNRAQSPPASSFALTPFMAAPAYYILTPFPAFPVASLPFPLAQFLVAAPPSIKETTPSKEKEKEGASNTLPTPAACTPSTAGLPALLLALMCTEDGPFLTNEVFSAPPAQPLAPIEEEVPAQEWYAITRGRFVGVVDQFALSAVAISAVGHNASKAYPTQALALNAFNQALTWGGVQVV